MENFKISCKNLPKIFFDDKNVAKNHFRRFGRIKKIVFKPKSKGCTVEYATEDGAQKAVKLGGIHENHIFEVVKDDPLDKRKRIKKDDDPDWLPDPDVLEELNAMCGGPSLGLASKYKLRPEGMEVEVTKETPKKIMKRQWPILEKKMYPKKIKPISTVSKNVLSEEQRELIEIIRKPAQSIDDKYKILDARDKLIRFFIKRDGNKSGATEGTCPDMCPEKERLLRVIQHQVSIYEQDSGREMNPSLAVKQYSRSSADQEASLPHELRPVGVLQMTMSYLVHRIMNLGDTLDVNIGDWYHFLWDRTRSIRKDITQQELCSPGSVTLVEQCARFHIHCSARLVAEDPSVFDQKINTENLTKCLQTLKYMYNDLKLKRIECPNEAEFRAYIILLNLNDGNFMWEVQKLRLEIQKSEEVKTAIKIYSALDKNNFIKFFKLVHVSTYLNACILMRYFIQVRIRAITMILKCYTPRITKVIYPLDKLTNNLGFESISHTIEFLHSCGLTITGSNSAVVLDRQMFTPPEFTYTSLDRSLNVVESKRKDLTVGQIICGLSLPPKDFETHIPQNSFNEKGVLKIDQYLKLKDLEGLKEIHTEVMTEKTSKIQSKSKFTSSKVANPYVYVKDSKASLVLSDSNTDRNEDALKRNVSNFVPVKSSIFSLDNRSKADNNVVLPTNIFGGKVIKSLNASDNQKQEKDLNIPSNLQGKGLNLFQNIPKNNFVGTSEKSQNIFGYGIKSNESLFGAKKDENPSGNIFGGTTLNSDANKFEGKSTDSVTSIFGNKTTIFGNQSKVFVETDMTKNDIKSKDDLDFKEIKWDIDSPEKEKESQNTFEDIFFKPVSSNIIGNYQSIVPKSIGGFFLPSVTINTPKKEDISNLPQKNESQKEQTEKQLQEAFKEKQRELEKEREKLEKEKQQRIRQLEVEREMAEKRRKDEEEQKKKLIEEQQREIERKKLREITLTINKLIPIILEKVEIQVRTEKLEELKKKMRKRFLLNVFQMWRKSAIKMKKKRKAIDCSPVWLCTRSPQQEASELRTESQNLTLKYMKRYKLGEPVTLACDEPTITRKIDFKELSDVIFRRYCQLGMKFFKDIYWKGVISLPGRYEMPEGRGRIEETLQQFIQWKEFKEETVLLEQYAFNCVQSVKYCIEKQNDLQVRHCDANGFIFIGKNYNQMLCKRILENVKAFGVFVRIPIVILLQEKPPNTMNFKILVEQGVISDYLILVDNLSPQKLIINIEKGLKFLLKNTQKPPSLELDTMKAFLIKNLCTEIWKRANSFCKWNSIYKNCLRNPNIVIDLYNEALAKLKNSILDKACFEFANFPEVFKELLPSEIPDCIPCDYKYFPAFFKDNSYFNYLSNIVNNLELKSLKMWPPENQFDLEKLLLKYCSELFKDHQRPFYKIMAVFLKHIDTDGGFEDIQTVVWTDVIEILALEKIRQTNFSLEDTEFFNKSVYNQLVVIYNPETLYEYINTDWFYVNNPIIKNI
ncbi:hypothetical protein HHI36_015385 [Cryptolaemus montrouzieri]|uniref:Germinal-center associated nuclear protein n=1 Tax=Cryptolaemus montrouzieri TaxID=559131 RepID=A0ABD2N5J2_9CUCU